MSEWGIDLNCFGCEHYHLEMSKFGTCDAYPDGIPLAIASGEFDHRKNFIGDRNLTYSKREIPSKTKGF